jgi:signal peptidase I
MKEKKRIPVIAAVLSLVAPGLGQLYNGQILKGIIFFLAILLIPTILFLAGLQSQFLGLAAILVFTFCLWLFVIVEAFFAAKRKKEVVLKGYNKWYLYLLIILLVNGTYFIPRDFTEDFASGVLGFRVYRIPAGSMEPTLLIGDYLITDSKYFKKNELQRRDLVIVQYPKEPSRDFIKRVIALEGEKIEIKNKQVYINDEVLPESYVVHNDVNSDVAIRDNFGPEVVPPNHCFVLGDNRDNSMDSRFWGSIPLGNIKGKPLYIYWAKDKSRIGKKLM